MIGRGSLGEVQKVLCLGAHADDIEIGCGGTLLRMRAARPTLEIHWVVFSAVGERREEAAASAVDFGGRHLHAELLDFEDSLFPTRWGAIKERFDAIRQHCPDPDLIFTHRLEDAHQDHRTVAELTWCTFRNHPIWSYEVPKYEGDLGHPNLLVKLDAEQITRKAELLQRHFVSQRVKPWFSAETFTGLARIRGVEAASAYAEGFYARKIVV